MKITKMLLDEVERVFGKDSVHIPPHSDAVYESKDDSGLWVVRLVVRKPHVHLYTVDSARNAARRKLYDLLRLVKPNTA